MRKVLSLFAVFGIVLSSFNFVPGQSGSTKSRKAAESQEILSKSRRVTKTEKTEFGRIDAVSDGRGALINWEMAVESAAMGYKIFRIQDGNRVQIDGSMLHGSFSRVGRYVLYQQEYSYFDRGGGVGSIYEIECQSIDGEITRSALISTTPGEVPKSRRNNSPGTDTTVISPNARPEVETLDLPKEVLEEMPTRFTQTDPDVHKWVMANPGVRLDVNKEGIYRVTFAQLQAAGFNTSGDRTNWQLYVRGIEQAIRIDESNEFIEFYGKGVDTPETDRQGYFLLNGPAPGKRIANVVARPQNVTVLQKGFSTQKTVKERNFYINSIFNGDAENFFGQQIIDSVGRNVTFELKGVDFSTPTASIEIKLQGYTSSFHTVQVTLNGEVLGNVTGVSQFPFSGTFSFSSNILRDQVLNQGVNTLNLKSIGAGLDNSFFDSITVSLSRKHYADGGILKGYTISSKVAQLRGFSSPTVRVFDITDDVQPKLITDLQFQSVEGTFGADLAAGRPRVFYAVEDSAILSAAAIRLHDNEVLGEPSHAADLIIISHGNFISQANTWATYRISQGFTVKVIDIDEITNEFNFGMSSAGAIKSFLSYAYNNWQTQPKYVLLIGDAYVDPKNYLNQGSFNFVPTKLITTTFTETGSDDSLADFDNDGLTEIPIGRIPARDSSVVSLVYNKTVNWETNLPANPLTKGALFAYDASDAQNDFYTMTIRLRDEITWPEGVVPTLVYRLETDAQAHVVSEINSGKYIVNWAGHGSAGVWGASSFFGSSTVNQLNNVNNESVFTMLTCLNGYFLGISSFPSLSERLLEATNGGAVAAWASTGLTTSSVQETMGRRFYNQVGQGNIKRLGDLVNDAKTVIPNQNDVRLSWAIIGDPMLKMHPTP